jgi:diadenylate cyclase
MDTLINLVTELHWYDILDILVVTHILVWLYSWVKGTRAFRILLGLGLLTLIYFWAQYLGLFLTSRVFEWLGQATLILVIVIFASEIRQVLERLNPLKIVSHNGSQSSSYISESVSALDYLARHRIGAILVFERSDRIRELVRSGIALNGDVQREILISIFQPQSPTHDGAVWIRDGRILEVAVFLPISQADLPLRYGSRHRAAVGITELSDAVVVVASEERGELSLAEHGVLHSINDAEQLATGLKERLHPEPLFSQPSWRSVFLRDWKVKLLALFLITSIWFAFAARQPSEATMTVPIHYMNVPEGVRVASTSAHEVSVRLIGPRRTVVSIRPETLALRVDLARVNVGNNVVPLRTDQINIPPDVRITQIEPQLLQIRTTQER